MRSDDVSNNLISKRILWMFIILISGLNTSFAHDPFIIPGCDSVHFTADSTQVIFYKKNKNGVYDLPSKTVLIKPIKNPILYLSSVHLYLQLTKNGFKINRFENDVERFNYTANNFNYLEAVFPAAISEIYNNTVFLHNNMLNYESGEIIQADSVFLANFQPETFFKLDSLDEKRLLIHYYRSPIKPLIISEGLYQIDSGFGHSGVFNQASKKWEIQPIYKTCEVKDTFIFCAIQTPNFAFNDAHFQFPFIWYANAYDIYVKRANEYVLKIQNLTQLTPENLQELMNWDKVELVADSSHILYEKQGKKGIWQIELNHYNEENGSNATLIFNELIANEHDYVFFEDETGLIFTYTENKGFTVHSEDALEDGTRTILNSLTGQQQVLYGRNDYENVLVIDQLIILFSDFLERKVTSISPNNSVRLGLAESIFTRACGLKWVNDSLVCQIDFKLDSIDNNANPLKSIFFIDEDSLILRDDGYYDWVYPPPIHGFEHSGIYNFESREWFMEPHYQVVTWNGNGFLGNEQFSKGNEKYDLIEHYTFVSTDGKIGFEDVNVNDIRGHLNEYLPLLLPGQGQQIKSLPEKSIRNLAGEEALKQDHYIQNDTGYWQVYQLFSSYGSIQLSPITKPKELVHYNPDQNYFVYLENDSLYLDFADSLYAVSANDASISIAFLDNNEFYNYRIALNRRSDTVFYYSSHCDTTAEYMPVAHFQQTADHLVINENYYLDNLQAYNVDMDEYWIFGEYPTRDYVFFYTETSVVWEKKDGKWKIASPYYASIEKCSLGYLVRTGVFERINKNTGETEVVNEARTLLLDHHLKPIPFLDYFDFGDGIAYDFGVSLCTQNGCFLIANNGKVITNDEWDLFELENGRVKAIRFKAIDPDDNIDTFEYFDLPTN